MNLSPEAKKAFESFLQKQPQSKAFLNLAKEGGLLDKDKTNAEKILENYITSDPDMLGLKSKVKLLAETKRSVFIIGETGTGKELIARALHGERKGPFVGVNCAGISDSLIESEFFGAVKGSYTGCDKDRQGYIEFASHGTLFLDEISEMPLTLQSKLLRVLENKTFRKVGDTIEREVNCRIIAATNITNLECLLSKLREDLYYRIGGSLIKTKPLRERREDIQHLCVYFDKQNKLPEELVRRWKIDCSTYVLRGNVRELKNMIEEYLEVGEVI